MIPHMNVLIKPASGACNMRCAYCFYADESAHRSIENYGMMSYVTLSNVVRKSILCASHSVTFAFQGGEPTLRGLDFFKELVRLEHKFNHKSIQIFNTVQTNGYALDEEWCQFFHDHNFLVGLSIDGTKDLHDAYRHDPANHPTYERIKKNAILLAQHQVNFNILTVVNRDVADAARQIYQAYRKNHWDYMQFIPCLAPLDTDRTPTFSPSPAAYGKFLCELFDCWYADVITGNPSYIRTFENYLGILIGMAPESCDMRGLCSIQHVVEADGSVYPCDFYVLDDYYIGNFNTDTIADITRRCQNLQFIEKSQKLPPACKDCPYFNLCHGGCMRHRIPDPVSGQPTNCFCESFRMFFSYSLPRLQDLALQLQHKS